jgi:hypothetical protein
MRQWIKHYIAEGVDHFVLVDNNRWPDTQYDSCALKDFIGAGVVTLIKDASINQHGHVLVGGHKDRQQVYLGVKHMHPFLKRSKFMMHVDADEFMYARLAGPFQSKTILGSLEQLADDQACIEVPWTRCGTPLLSQPEDVIESITQCTLPTDVDMLKWACRSNAIEQYWVHNIVPTPQARQLNPACGVVLPDGTCLPWMTGSLKKDTLARGAANHSLGLNHYQVQSRQYFAQSKMIRGNIMIQGRNQRDWKYFEAREHFKESNTELRDKRRRGRSMDQAAVDKALCAGRHVGGKRPVWCPQ